MTSLLEAWVGPRARSDLTARYPEVRLVADTTAAILEAQGAAVLDRASLRRGAQITRAYRKGLGILQEQDRTLPIDVRCALNLVVRGVRDASYVLAWPSNPEGRGLTLRLAQPALEALARLEAYDPLLGTATYTGTLLEDLRAIADGLRIDSNGGGGA